VVKVQDQVRFTINPGSTEPLPSVSRPQYLEYVIRQWLIAWLFPPDYGDNGLKRFDKVVKLAEEKGIKLVVTLTNNWADYVRIKGDLLCSVIWN